MIIKPMLQFQPPPQKKKKKKKKNCQVSEFQVHESKTDNQKWLPETFC